MNLQPVPIEDIPLGEPLPWRLYDHNGYIVFTYGEIVASREQLENLLPEGLLRDIDASPQLHETADALSFSEAASVVPFPPSGIKPQIGDRLQLRLLNQHLQIYYSARLIGYIKKSSILVTRPISAENPFIPTEGQELEARMVTGNNIYIFRSSIQRLCISPVHYMHLDYPSEVLVQKLRRSPWVNLNLGVTVTDARGAHEAAHLVNLSPDGAQLHAPATLGKPGEMLKLSFHAAIDEMKTTLTLNATIMHANAPQDRRKAEVNMLEYGVAFCNITATDSLWLKGLVYRHIAGGSLA